MNDLLAAMLAIMSRTGISKKEWATLAGVSPSTIIRVFRTQELPDRRHARERIEACIHINLGARRRGDLRLVP